MLTIEDAQTRILAHALTPVTEPVPLHEADGRVLAAAIKAPVAIPHWDNSAMDGYAVRAADTAAARPDNGVLLSVIEVIAAGSVATKTVGPGQAAAIMTGAPVPQGADAVVAVEDTEHDGDDVRIFEAAHLKKHIRFCGEAVAIGDGVLEAGTVLRPGAIGLLASLGIPHVLVAQRPVIAVLSTGDECVSPGEPLGPGQIYGSNGVALCAQIRAAGGGAVDLGNVPDDPDALANALRDAVQRADAVITTGGVSVGRFDHVKSVYAELGVSMDFWKVRMKPGKPLAFGNLGKVPLFGLPGNPVSCMVNFAQFVRPWLRTSLGDLRPFLPVVDASAGEDFFDRPGRARLLRVRLHRDDKGLVATSTGTQSSGAVVSMAHADGLLLVSPDHDAPLKGAPIQVQLLHDGFLHGETPNYGW